MLRKINQLPTEVFRSPVGDGMIFIKQYDSIDSNEFNFVVIHPLFLPQVVAWLQELLAEIQPTPEA